MGIGPDASALKGSPSTYDVVARGIDVVDGENVGMVERRGGAGFLFEPRAALRVAGAVGENLDGDAAAQPRVVRFVHDPHAPAADLTADVVAREELHGGGADSSAWFRAGSNAAGPRRTVASPPPAPGSRAAGVGRGPLDNNTQYVY